MKVAVYTIALNEAAHVERWANSASDADYRIVADTGSTDGTSERLMKAGVTVHSIAVRPWRFDDARNALLALIPSDVDICVILDMDQFLNADWRPKLEAAWVPGTTALRCRIECRSSLDDKAPRTWSIKKIHARWGYRFRRPVHETPFRVGGEEVTAHCAGTVIHEIQDRTKGTRAQYLPLLELAHQEDPNDSQICFWLARDYMYARRNEEAATKFEHYLELPSSAWADERSEAMRYLARVQPQKKAFWLERGRLEAPHRREVWLDLAEWFHDNLDWTNLFWACANGLEKTRMTGSYLDDNGAWGSRLFDLGAIASWHLNVTDRALEWGRKALELAPNDERLKNNVRVFIQPRDEVRRGA
jgi:hypothetical protein